MSPKPADSRARRHFALLLRPRSTTKALVAIAEPRRWAILELVTHEELAAGEIATHFEVTRTAVSQHLTVLKKAGLIAERRDGTRRLYRARPEGLDDLRQLLESMWASSLDIPGPAGRGGTRYLR